MDKLTELLAKGPDPARGLRGLVLGRYHEIAQAKRQLWHWGEIAEALGLLPAQGPAVGEAFRRIAKRIKAGQLEPPAAPSTAPQARPTIRAGAISADAAKSEPIAKPVRPGFKKIELPN